MIEMIKFLPISMLYPVISLLLVKLGNFLKEKDDNASGPDDAAGNVCLALAPVITALENNHDTALRKALMSVRDTIDGYLRLAGPHVPSVPSPSGRSR